MLVSGGRVERRGRVACWRVAKVGREARMGKQRMEGGERRRSAAAQENNKGADNVGRTPGLNG